MAQPRKFPQFPLANTLTGNELVLLWQGLGNRRITLDTLKAFFGEGGGTELSQDIIDALEGANTPSGSNVFATMADVGSGGGFTDVGAGLSIDGDGNPQFGKEEDGIYYLDGDEFDDWNGFVFASNFDNYYNGTGGVFGFFEILGDSPQFGFEDLDLEKTGFFRLNENIVGVQSSGTGARIDIEQIPPDDVGVRRMTMLNSFLITDTVSNKGLENAGDYEANFTARSLVTKQWVENNYYPEGFILTTNTVVFNRDNVSGITTARTGDVLVDLTNAKVYGTFTMIHNDASAFGFFLPDGVTPFVFYQSNPDDYVAGSDNILDFQFIGDGKVRLTISQPD
jgi:hypothetical protein